MEDARAMQVQFRKMGVAEDRIFLLKNPTQKDFYEAIEKVKQLAKNGERTQLFLHYAGHGMVNGGYIADFAHFTVNFSEATSGLSR